MVQAYVAAGPEPFVAPKELQRVSEPLVVLWLFENSPVNGIVKPIYKQYDHGKATKYVKQEQQRGIIAKKQYAGIKSKVQP